MPRLTPHVPAVPGMRGLGEYVREQRENAHLSVRQLSAAAGISNPYLSQIERGLRRPSAEILNALAKGLQISAESLYVQAGLLDASHESGTTDVRLALKFDRHLGDRQRQILLDLYDSFVPDAASGTHVAADDTFGHDDPADVDNEHVDTCHDDAADVDNEHVDMCHVDTYHVDTDNVHKDHVERATLPGA